MNKKTLRIITIVSTVLIILAMCTVTLAVGSPAELKNKINTEGTDNIDSFGGKVMGILQTAGIVIAVVVIMVLGIKYMIGSAEEKAEYKKTMIPYIVGAVLLFAATTIANMIYQFAIKI